MIRASRASAVFVAFSLALASCGPAPTTTVATVGSPIPQLSPYAAQSSESLWWRLDASTDTREIMLIEAELAARGQLQSGTRFVGQKTAGTVGRSVYGRSEARSGDKDCSSFSSAAEAQRFFLLVGGPARDPHGLDRDGDGNACDWGSTLRRSASSYRPVVAPRASVSRAVSSSRCYVGPRGGTYTITASGRKNYGGC